MTIEEIVDYVQQDLTMSCALPKLLPDQEIRRLIVRDATPWFYENYFPSVIKSYYLVPYEVMRTDEFTKYKCIQF